jgi:hypothetical protein
MSTYPLPPPTPVTSSCSGLTYSFPSLPQSHISYNIKLNSIPGPPIKIPINIPEVPIYIPLPKIFRKVPKIDKSCSNARQDMIYPGIPCEIKTCYKKVCKQIKRGGVRIRKCVNVPYPCSKFRGQLYLENDTAKTIPLFTIPKLGLIIDANSFANTEITVELWSETAIISWINFLIDSGISSSEITDTKSVLDRLMITAKKSLGGLLILLARYFQTSKIPITLSIKIKKLILDIKWNVNYIKLYVGSKEIELRDLSFTFKNIDILKLINAEEISLTLTSSEIVFSHVLGSYSITGSPYTIILTMIRDKISQLKSIYNPGYIVKNEIEKLETALDYVERLTDVGEMIPILKIPQLNFFKKMLDVAQVKVILSLRFCPLIGTCAVCATIAFDLSEFLKLAGNFLKNDVKDSLDGLEKYNPFPSGDVKKIKPLADWNEKFDKANKTVRKGVGIVLDRIGNGLLNDSNQFFYGSATICAPI